jgi:hypothetical protein
MAIVLDCPYGVSSLDSLYCRDGGVMKKSNLIIMVTFCALFLVLILLAA